MDELQELREANRTLSHQLERRADGMDDLTQELRAKYHELLYAVANKYPNETRHETALRYIRQAETITSECKEAI